MNSKLKSGLIFLSGAVSGAVGALVFVKTKWQKDFEAKREEMIRYFETKKKDKKPVNDIPEEIEEEENDEKETLEEAKGIIQKFNYSKISTPEKTKNESPILNDADYSTEPYPIDSRDFGSQEMYDMVTLYLYDDGELCTGRHEPLDDEDIDNYIGVRNMQTLADLRDEDPDMDSFYVRNDRLKTDYEILLEAGRYDE